MEANQYQKLPPREVLKHYEHIELTQEEMDEAILSRKMQKEDELRMLALREREEKNRKALTGLQWDAEQTKAFMEYRAHQLFGGKFILDKDNIAIFTLLCCYFSNDKNFVSYAMDMGIKNPSLEKGIFLAGNFGVGKTWFMKLFSKNQKQSFRVFSAKQIANTFESDGEDAIHEYDDRFKNAFEDPGVMYQKYSGICIDDLGTEDIKNHYGNKKNVIGDLIETRYNRNVTGIWFHATSNLSADQLAEFYGKRVTSRIREIFNLIEFRGADRRK